MWHISKCETKTWKLFVQTLLCVICMLSTNATKWKTGMLQAWGTNLQYKSNQSLHFWTPHWKSWRWAYREPHMTSTCLKRWGLHNCLFKITHKSLTMCHRRLNGARKQVASCLHTLNILFWPCAHNSICVLCDCTSVRFAWDMWRTHCTSEDTVERSTTLAVATLQ